MTTHPIPDRAYGWIASYLNDAGIDGGATVVRPGLIAFGEVDTPRGHAYQLHVTGGAHGYDVEITDFTGDTQLAVAADLTAADIVDLCEAITSD